MTFQHLNVTGQQMVKYANPNQADCHVRALAVYTCTLTLAIFS